MDVIMHAHGDGTLMVPASQRLLWRVRPEKDSKCIDVADGSVGSVESIESIGSIGSTGYIEYIVHTGNTPSVK